MNDTTIEAIERTDIGRFRPSRVHATRKGGRHLIRRMPTGCDALRAGLLRASSMRHQHDVKVEPEIVTSQPKS